MTDEEWQDANKKPSDREVAFDYIKADGFRSIWVDGAIGGLTPRGVIHFALYSERPAIPRRQVYALETRDEAKGILRDEVLKKRISRDSVVREMACDVFLSPETALELATWLQHVAEQAKKVGDS